MPEVAKGTLGSPSQIDIAFMTAKQILFAPNDQNWNLDVFIFFSIKVALNAD